MQITVTLADGNYSGETIAVPLGVKLVIDGTTSSITFVGHSPAFIVNSGDVSFNGITFTNSTDAPTILVTAGNVSLRNCTVQETNGGNQAAIKITGGNVDLGTAFDPGGNTINVRGLGFLIQVTGGQNVSAVGNTFQQDGTTVNDRFAIEDRIYDGLDAAGLGTVRLADGALYVTVASGSIQRGVDAAFAGDTVFVQAGVSQSYNAGSKLLTVAFQNGATVSQQVDDVKYGTTMLVVTGTDGPDTIKFTKAKSTDEVKLQIAGFPTGSFMPTSRLIAYGLGGDDVIDASNSVQLSAWLYGGDGNDTLKGGGGNDVIEGGDGNDVISGCGGADLLIGGGGSDQIDGKGGQDILISGTTAFDANDAVLLSILNEWTSGRTYSQRVANILGTGTGATFAARMNGNLFLNTDSTRGAVTVMDDSDADTLKGGAGTDLYFANLVLDSGDDSTVTDQIIGLKKNEVAVDTDLVSSDNGGGGG